MDDFMEDFAAQAEQQNKELYAWEAKIEELYKRADSNLNYGINYADSLIKKDKRLDKWEVSELHTIIGELYYDNDSIDLAIERFKIEELLTSDSPRNKANKAGCYIKQGDYDKAMTLLKEAAEVNHAFKWYIGNLYEIQGYLEKAKQEYQYVYQRDTAVYAYYNQRIQELNNKPEQLLTELYYKDRRRRTLLLWKDVNSDTSGTSIGRFDIEKK
jgi:tetratricopeptide (TPR) repeat protein